MTKYTWKRNYDIKSKPTVYTGMRKDKPTEFKSKLEARWAVLFDLLGQEWEYEPHAILVDGSYKYCPDFWIPKSDCYYEIKPGVPTEEEYKKAEMCLMATGKDIFFLCDTPMSGMNFGILNRVYGVFKSHNSGYIYTGDHDEYYLSWCKYCKRLRPTLYGATEMLRRRYSKDGCTNDGCCPMNDSDSLGQSDTQVMASFARTAQNCFKEE